MLTMTNDGLVGFRKVGGIQGIQLVPDLAVSLPTPTDGGKGYTFEVRRGIRYSSGKLVRPADFRSAIERLFELGSPGAPYYARDRGSRPVHERQALRPLARASSPTVHHEP